MSGERSHILLVDPVRESREMCRAILERAGWKVEEAGTLQEATEHVGSASLAICDPAAQGLLRAVRPLLEERQVPLLGASAAWSGRYNHALAIRTDGLGDLLPAPVSGEELLTWVTRLLGEPPAEPSGDPIAVGDAHAEASLPDDVSEEFPQEEGATKVGDVESLLANDPAFRQERPTPSAVQALPDRTEAPTGRGEQAVREEDVRSTELGVGQVEAPRAAAPEKAKGSRAATPVAAASPARALLVPRVLDPGAVPEQGEFEESVWPAVLALIGAGSRTGFLLVAGGSERLILGVEGSRVVSADSSALPFAQWLRDSGLIDEEGLQTLREVASSTGREERELLDYARKGLQLDLSDLEGAWLKAVLFRPFGWAEGRFAWREEPVALPEPLPATPDLTEVIWEGVSHGTDLGEADAMMKAFARQPLALRPGATIPSSWWLSDDQRALADRLATGEDVERTSAERRSPEVSALVYALLAAGLAGFAP